MSLPWLWGEKGAARDAERASLNAAEAELRAARVPIEAEVATAEADTRANARRLEVMRDRALTAAKRAFDVASAGYESGRVELSALLSARRTVVEIENEIVMTRAALDHALAELDAAVGTRTPRRALGTPAATATANGGDHGDR